MLSYSGTKLIIRDNLIVKVDYHGLYSRIELELKAENTILGIKNNGN